MRRIVLLIPLLATGCFGEDVEISWLRGFGFGWTGFNHRVSYLHFAVEDDGLDMAIIGGASSTNYVPDLPEGCDPDACDELPFDDTSSVTIAWGRTTTSLATGSAEATVFATPTGGQQSLEIPLEGRGKGHAAVMLQALTVDTDYALSGGDDCYIPMLGWHPRHMAVSLVDPQLSDDGKSVTVTLKGSFEAGYSFEEYRACQDDVVEEAQVPITVRVLAIATPNGLEQHGLQHDLHYEFTGNQFDPEEQPDPPLEERALALSWDDAIAGWSAIDFRFDEDDPDLRGAYLRTLSVGFDPAEGWASGHASNYSPGTQLSDFGYAFEGQITAVEADGAMEWGSATFDEIEAELDDDARPVLHHQGWK